MHLGYSQDTWEDDEKEEDQKEEEERFGDWRV